MEKHSSTDLDFKDAIFVTDDYLTNDLYQRNSPQKQQNFLQASKVPDIKQVKESINDLITNNDAVSPTSKQQDTQNISKLVSVDENNQPSNLAEGFKAPSQTSQDNKNIDNQWENLPDYVQEEKEDILEAQQQAPKFYKACETRSLKILVLGQSGIGRTTFIRNLFMSYAQDPNFSPKDASKVSWDSFSNFPEQILTEVTTQEDSKECAKYQFLIQDTPALQNNNEVQVQRIIRYLEKQYYQQYIRDINLGDYDISYLDEDAIVHSIVDLCCYMLAPHQITQYDIDSMIQLAKHVPVVPILAKADCLDPEELQAQRQKLYEQLEGHGILSFTDDVLDRAQAKVQPCPPFAIVASNQLHPSIPYWPIRKYRWGQCCAYRERDSDLKVFRRLVFQEGFFQVKEASKQLYRKFCQRVHGPLIKKIIHESKAILMDQANVEIKADIENDQTTSKDIQEDSSSQSFQLREKQFTSFKELKQFGDEVFDPDNYVEVTIKEIQKKEGVSYKIFLKTEDNTNRVVRIRVGIAEGQSLTQTLEKKQLQSRPQAYDIFTNIFKDLSLYENSNKLSRVVVEALRDSVYYCRLWVCINGSERSYDCRPSDGINLAVRLNAPILISQEVAKSAYE